MINKNEYRKHLAGVCKNIKEKMENSLKRLENGDPVKGIEKLLGENIDLKLVKENLELKLIMTQAVKIIDETKESFESRKLKRIKNRMIAKLEQGNEEK